MKRLISYIVVGLALVLGGGAAWAACSDVSHAGKSFTACSYDVRKDHVALFNLDENDIPLGNFSRLSSKLAAGGKELDFAMNAGMYDQNLRPVGLYVEDGIETKKLNHRNGAGNFHLKPNGVFYIKGDRAGVMETEAYAKSGIKPDFASQSGPMLVVNGKIHPKLSPTGVSAKIRNGVGMVDDHTLVFVISNEPVAFYDFASVFRDEFSCKNALFLDGSISSLFSRELNRDTGYVPLGPMVGVYHLP